MVESLLLIQALDFLVHRVDKEILFLLGLLEVSDIFFCAVSCTACYSDLTLHHLVVFFNLLECTVELVKLFLRLEHTLKLLIGLFFTTFILFLENLKLFLGVNTILLHDIVVIVSTFKCGLHLCELMLHSVQLHTDLLALLLYFPDFLFLNHIHI